MNRHEDAAATSGEYAVLVKETSTHTVYVRAANAKEAHAKARDASNWLDDDLDHTLVSIIPQTVRTAP